MTQLIVALDMENRGEILGLAEGLEGLGVWGKIGHQAFTHGGPGIVRELRDLGVKVFLDLKFHDIPNTVAKAVVEAARLGVSMVNLHCAGGSKMMATARRELDQVCADEGLNAPLLIGVTVLTSMSQEDLEETGVKDLLPSRARSLAKLGQDAGLDGVVASPHEIEVVKNACGSDFQVVTPGIRPAGSAMHDQSRVMTPAQAHSHGADFIVVGRPITQAKNPADAVKSILAEIS